MPWTRRQATNYKDLLAQVRAFTQKECGASGITRVTGTVGRIYGASASENSIDGEIFTLSCITAGGDGVAVFSVVGSLVGALPNATAGVPYSQSPCSFIIVADGGTFVSTGGSKDVFTFYTLYAAASWIEDRWDTNWEGSSTDQIELIQHGIGASADEIYVGYRTRSDLSTYWNLETAALSGFVAHSAGMRDKPLSVQPGYQAFWSCLNNSSFSFLCIFTSRHIKIIPTTVTGEQGSSYVGWFLPFATPSQWSYPMFVGGSTRDFDQKIETQLQTDHTCYWNRALGDSYQNGAVLDSSIWRTIIGYSPRTYGDFTSWRGTYRTGQTPLFPAVPIIQAPPCVYGELEGVYFPSPYATGLLSAGDIIATASVVAECCKDVSRGGPGSIIAMDFTGD